jgi:hypothetical protein
MQFLNLDLYRTKVEIHWAIKEQLQLYAFARNSKLLTACNKSSNLIKVKLKIEVVARLLKPISSIRNLIHALLSDHATARRKRKSAPPSHLA